MVWSAETAFSELNREPATQTSLHDLNIALLDAVEEVFRIKRYGKWSDFPREVTPGQIRAFYRLIAQSWRADIDYVDLLPEPGPELRALYLGDIDPRSLLRNIFRFSLYADEILVVNPFHHPWQRVPKFNPITNPAEFQADTLKLIHFAYQVAPWIRSGYVTLVPHLIDTNPEFRDEAWALAEKRVSGLTFAPEDVEYVAREMIEEVGRALFALPNAALEETIRVYRPGTSDDLLARMVAYAKKLNERDPIALDEYGPNDGPQLVVKRASGPLEAVVFLAQATGAFPYTDAPFRWRELVAAQNSLPESARIWTPLTRAFGSLEFKFLNDIDSHFAHRIREEERLGSFRAFLRRLWSTAGGDFNAATLDSSVRNYRDELAFEYNKAEAEWDDIDADWIKWLGLSAAAGIAGGAGIGIAIATGALVPAIGGTVVAGASQLLQRHLKRRQFRKKNPMSVFVDLARYRDERE